MAEIKIEKKKPIWPWILLVVLIILALLYFFVFANNDYDDDTIDTDDMEQVQPVDSIEQDSARNTWTDEVNNDSLSGDFTTLSASYFSAMEETSKLGSDTLYTKNTLLKLVDAVKSKAMENQVELETDFSQVRENVMGIADSTRSFSSEKLKNIAKKTVEAAKTIQQKEYPQLEKEIKEAQTSVEEIAANAKMNNQQEKIKTFFEKMAAVLKNMN